MEYKLEIECNVCKRGSISSEEAICRSSFEVLLLGGCFVIIFYFSENLNCTRDSEYTTCKHIAYVEDKSLVLMYR